MNPDQTNYIPLQNVCAEHQTNYADQLIIDSEGNMLVRIEPSNDANQDNNDELANLLKKWNLYDILYCFLKCTYYVNYFTKNCTI